MAAEFCRKRQSYIFPVRPVEILRFLRFDVYGVLHRPSYREKFAENLKRELPRIPFLADFRALVDAGRRLADLHVGYEQVEPWRLDWVTAPGTPVDFRVEKMRLSKDKTTLVVNPTLALAGLPPEVFAYRLGNRSALEWVIDQYQVSTDARSGLTTDPNRADDLAPRLVPKRVRDRRDGSSPRSDSF